MSDLYGEYCDSLTIIKLLRTIFLVITPRQLFVVITVIVLSGIATFLITNGLFTKTENSGSISVAATPTPSVVLGAAYQLDQTSQNMQNANPSQASNPNMPSVMQFDNAKKYLAVLHTTEGDIKIEFEPQNVPFTVSNFVFLAKKGFYDGTKFHRAIKGFMIQGGDPKGDGTGDPGYRFKDEPIQGEYKRGTVAMANSGPNTNGSQFFIMHQDYALPKNYVIFGQVVEGIEVVDKIAESPTTRSATGENSKPVNPVTVSSVEVVEK